MDNLPETIDITPDWQGMFQYAIHLTEHGLSEGEGQQLVVMMLQYGQRLEQARQAINEAVKEVCSECGERIPDSDAVMHYHPGAVIALEKENNG